MRAVISTVDIKPEAEGPYVKYYDYQQSLDNYRGWLQYIADVALDRDGFKSATDLGKLVDELRSFAIAALDEETTLLPPNRSHGDTTKFPGKLVAVDLSDDSGRLTVSVGREWLDTHVLKLNAPCFIRGLENKEIF
jgi:hypothetical protein